mmetsp:Transcript_62458/g.103884  ORF Transcript_62458/g.103884 Transcript_62458/m.103884 type:complete len:278 (-) Transcript_62458:14-847(-)
MRIIVTSISRATTLLKVNQPKQIGSCSHCVRHTLSLSSSGELEKGCKTRFTSPTRSGLHTMAIQQASSVFLRMCSTWLLTSSGPQQLSGLVDLRRSWKSTLVPPTLWPLHHLATMVPSEVVFRKLSVSATANIAALMASRMCGQRISVRRGCIWARRILTRMVAQVPLTSWHATALSLGHSTVLQLTALREHPGLRAVMHGTRTQPRPEMSSMVPFTSSVGRTCQVKPVISSMTLLGNSKMLLRVHLQIGASGTAGARMPQGPRQSTILLIHEVVRG